MVETPGIRHIAFAVEDMDAVVASASPRRGARWRGGALRGQLWLCYVRGPEGIFVVLAEQIG
jgi:hypothetical protein